MASNGELEDNEVGEGSSEAEDVELEEVGEIQKVPHCLTMMRDGFEYQELEVDEEYVNDGSLFAKKKSNLSLFAVSCRRKK